jgi:hypothetical protein
MKADRWVGRWRGRTVVCLASGPSLTVEDCDRVRESGHPAIVTNTTFKLCPWAEVLFGYDSAWWKKYRGEVDDVFSGERLTLSPNGKMLGAQSLHAQAWFSSFWNSGACAISLAVVGGASRIVLLGYDCQKTDGRSHWHGDHPEGLGNAKSLPKWSKHFAGVARYAEKHGAKVLNCTRQTALTCFEKTDLEAAL